MRNLHIILNSFHHETRILKETSSLLDDGKVSEVFVVALHQEGLLEHESLGDKRSLWRVPLKSRGWKRAPSALLQGLRYLELCWRMVRFVRNKRIQIINIHNCFALPLGVLLKWVCGGKLVYDAHELETEAFGLTGFSQTVARIIERSTIRLADLVIVVGDEIEHWYRDRYGIDNIVTVLNTPPRQFSGRSNLLAEDLGIDNSKRIVIYQGGLVPGRGVEGLLRAFDEWNDGEHVLVFMGYGSLEQTIREYADRCANIYLHEAVEPDVILNYTCSAHVGVSYIDNPSLNDHFCLPNKFFEYMASGLPVLVNNAPAMRRIVEQYGVGAVMTELSGVALAQGLRDLEGIDDGKLSARLEAVTKETCWERQSDIMLAAYSRWVTGYG